MRSGKSSFHEGSGRRDRKRLHARWAGSQPCKVETIAGLGSNLAAMSTKKRGVIWGGAIMGAEIRANV
jgi:hypothetical protein